MAHHVACDMLAEQAAHPNSTPVEKEAWVRWNNDQRRRAGRGHTHMVTATPNVWNHLRGEMLYRWEISGGNGNPYGIDREDLPLYADERTASKTAMLRIQHALHQHDEHHRTFEGEQL